jgi:hypothetical protein
MERLKALDLLAKYGGLTRLELTGTDGESVRPRQCFIIAGREVTFLFLLCLGVTARALA